MEVDLAYGRNGLTVTLPAHADVIQPRYVQGLADEAWALHEALRHPIGSPPLADLVGHGDTVCIVHTDITRATPNERILPVLIDELRAAGVAPGDIFLLNGLGTHRRQTDAELRAMLGDEIVDTYRCLQHDCSDDANLVDMGATQLGHPVRINRDYLRASVKILTGFIEPHFFAGFSGGPKAILPSLSGVESVYTNHGQEMIAHPSATWGITEGNPIWDEMRQVALSTDPTFLLNVTLNAHREITGVFAGDMLQAHAEGCRFVKETAMAPVEDLYDIVVTTNSGYPLDQNLYQSVKGMSAARQIVREGGAIVIAAACEDGLPNHGLYAELLARAGSPRACMDMISEPGFCEQDQWQVQVQAQIQLHADVYVYSDGLTDQQIADALFISTRSVDQTVAELADRYGSDARICVMPEGPLTIPYLRRETAGAGQD